MKLQDLIGSLINTRGFITIGELMTLAAQHPKEGYYRAKAPIGADADFITAPEISQIFGEMIGLCLANHWLECGAPGGSAIAELGPGTGTLLADLLRALNQVKAGGLASSVHLIESDTVLADMQRQRIGSPVRHHQDLSTVPAEGPVYWIANEFFDALPARQFDHCQGQWFERVVTIDQDRPVFAAHPADPVFAQMLSQRHAIDGTASIVEVSPAREELATDLAKRIHSQGGAALIIDYGAANAQQIGDSLQAVRRHEKVDPLAMIGSSDLTTQVDFGALRRAAEIGGVRVQGPLAQGSFLEILGAGSRLEQLCRRQAKADRAALERGYSRLADMHEMGTLFQVLAITSGDAPALLGFDRA